MPNEPPEELDVTLAKHEVNTEADMTNLTFRTKVSPVAAIAGPLFEVSEAYPPV